MRQAQFLLGETPLCPRCCWFEPIMSWPWLCSWILHDFGAFWCSDYRLCPSRAKLFGAVERNLLWTFWGIICCESTQQAIHENQMTTTRWPPPRSAMKHRLSPVRSLGKRRFTSDTCRICVLAWRSERTTFCLSCWFLRCLYKLHFIKRLWYDECSAIDIITSLYDVSRHHVQLAVLLHLFASHTVSGHSLFMNGSCFPNPWPTHSESKDTNWACSISSLWSGRKRMSIWIACMFQWTLTRPQMHVALVQNHKGGIESSCVSIVVVFHAGLLPIPHAGNDTVPWA